MYRAVIIDDEKWVVQSLLATLGIMDGFEIADVLYDGISALKYLKEKKPDLAFLDVRLPGMTGLDLLEKADRAGSGTLFIIISGYADFSYAQTAMLHGAIGYCLKPFSKEELTAAVAKAFRILQERKQTARLSALEDVSGEGRPSSFETADVSDGLSGNSSENAAMMFAGNPSAAKNSAVSVMLSYIQEHYMEDISIQTLADLCSINPNYAGQLFKQKMNQTFNSYLTGLRIQQAISLLTNTDMPVALVASSVGYQDYFYFAKVFKKITQQTPSSFRQEENLFDPLAGKEET